MPTTGRQVIAHWCHYTAHTSPPCHTSSIAELPTRDAEPYAECAACLVAVGLLQWQEITPTSSLSSPSRRRLRRVVMLAAAAARWTRSVVHRLCQDELLGAAVLRLCVCVGTSAVLCTTVVSGEVQVSARSTTATWQHQHQHYW